jgi:hypothetical protein
MAMATAVPVRRVIVISNGAPAWAFRGVEF